MSKSGIFLTGLIGNAGVHVTPMVTDTLTAVADISVNDVTSVGQIIIQIIIGLVTLYKLLKPSKRKEIEKHGEY